MKKYFIILSLSLTTSCATFSNKNTVGQFPIYGNWCGPAHPAKNTNPKPIDSTDLACKNHDFCYEQKGYLNKSCDEALVAELKANSDNICSIQEKHARKAIISYFRRSPKL